ncbi:MAG TPA: hypothetical protein VF587_17505 [Solirubrobacteraceae bacterium]|jgi:hypothetical protein
MTNVISPIISIRAATTGDGPALARLAALDSAPVPFGPVLVAEVDGQPRAALSVADDRVIGDPFTRTAELVQLLRVHARATAAREDSLRLAA